jgi:glycosidase
MFVNAKSAANVNDIMLQAFGWDVHTKTSVSSEGGLYNYLKNRTPGYAAAGFNVIWLPPPSKSTGGVGYISTELFNFSQTSYGSEAQLRALLTAFNTSNPRIHPMADIVVNHRGGTTNWTDFTNPTWDCSSITSNDEANFGTISGVRPCGTPDTGEDFNGGRDLDHTNIQVQNGVREYLTRLKALGFDSWRWDVAKGFSASYFGDYINSSDGYSYTWGAAARTLNPENSANKVVVYPNPVSDILQITSESTIQDYKLITVQGTVLQKGKSVESGIDMSSLNSGLYLIQLRFENGEEETRKIFKR